MSSTFVKYVQHEITIGSLSRKTFSHVSFFQRMFIEFGPAS
jgi:hypothetical protein